MSNEGLRKWLLVAVVAALCGSSAAFAGVPGLSARIEAEKSFLSGGDAAVVQLTLRNEGARDLYVLHWQTPLRGVKGDLFDVRVGGRPVAYTGRLTKWGAPKAEDYVRIPAGRTVSVRVDLSRYYDLTATGEYSVRYRVPVQDALRGTGTKIDAVAGLNEVESNVLLLGIERDAAGRFLQEIAQREAERIDNVIEESVTPGFVSCTSTRQSTLSTALGNAEAISLKARDYLNNLPSTQRPTDAAYATWFGSYTSSRYSTVQSHYVSIHSAFNTQTVTFHCDCTDSSYAYVFSNQPYHIHLCNAFWNAPNLGIDSKAGTLVHEMSHFNVTAGTSDYAYGTAACQRLASTNPKKAINNADSHEYFAETR